ncbi:HypC/HybG/HupF family hydrogenase formation chaperone [Azospirillum sp. sgz301742]
MCIGIPMRVLETDGILARCAGRGEERMVNLLLVGEVPVGAWVLVHIASAVRELDEEDVAPLNDALDAILLAAQGGNTDHLFADILAAREAAP